MSRESTHVIVRYLRELIDNGAADADDYASQLDPTDYDMLRYYVRLASYLLRDPKPPSARIPQDGV